MGIRMRKLAPFFLLPLLMSCGLGSDKSIDDPYLYNGCYIDNNIPIILENGTVKTRDGNFPYEIYPKKIGIVLSPKFYLKNYSENSSKFLPNTYEKFYLIRSESIKITDSSSFVHIFKKAEYKFCEDLM